MTQLNPDEIRKLHQQTFIPGPLENETSFRQRVEECLQTKKKLPSFFKELSPDAFDDQTALWEELAPHLKTQQLGNPHWLPILFSNHQLPFWQGGCAWIYQLDEKTPTSAFLQLRRSFKHSTHYLGLYDRTELITHEIVHVARMVFEEPQFEEILAYQTSPSRLRRALGALLQNAQESLYFVLFLGAIFLLNLAFSYLEMISMERLLIINSLPLVVLFLAWIRLVKRQQQLKKCLKNLSLIVNQQAFELCLGLTDEEIRQFAAWPIDQTRRFIQQESSFRWHFLRTVFEIN